MEITDGMERGEGDRTEGRKCPCLFSGGAFKSALGQMMDCSLLKNPVFLLIAISNVFGMLGFYVPFVYIIDSAVQTVNKTKLVCITFDCSFCYFYYKV
jgi:hypothetical protein